jgi:hypothetical protein
MPTVDEVLNIERSFLGEGGNRFWDWYPAAYGTAWCDIFQSYCLTAAGIPTHFAWVSAHFDYYRAQGRNSYDIRTAQPGDLIAFEWNSTPGGYDHTAMVESVDANGVTALNGNVNGSRVQRLWHPFNGGGIAEIARPPYTAPTPPPVPNHIIGDDEMIDRFLARADGHPEVFLVAPGLGFRWWLPNEDRLRSAVYILNSFGGKILTPPPAAKVDIVAGQPVWVMNPADLAMIPLAA